MIKLFGYYALHSAFNQIRKLCRSWVAILVVVCVLVGALIGVGAALLDEALGDTEGDAGYEQELPEDDAPLTEEERVQMMAVLELVAGGIALAVLLFACMRGEKSGGNIFMMADVDLLFASPMKPQSVLLFRMMANLGAVVLLFVYLLFQLPNLVTNAGLSLFGVIGILVAVAVLVAFLQVTSTLIYLLGASYPRFRRAILPGVITLLVVLTLLFLGYQSASGLDRLSAALSFFNAPVSRYIPLWGWTKGMAFFAIEGDAVGFLLSLLLSVCALGVMMLLAFRMRVDFYEEAMAHSEQMAEATLAAQEGKGQMREKERSEKIRRDGLVRGEGAAVFYTKAMYNRRRFAKFGILTKTMLFYLAISLIFGLFGRHNGTDNALILGLSLAAVAFYRSLGDPIGTEAEQPLFRMVPASAHLKVFYCLMGGLVSAALDLLPAFVLGALFFPKSILTLLGLYFFALVVDLYSATVGFFLTLSIPSGVDKNIRNVILILFVYFGLLPVAAIALVGMLLGLLPLFLLLGGLFALAVSGVFFAVSPLFLIYGSR